MKTRVVIVEDQLMFLQLLSGMLRSQRDVELLATSTSATAAKEAFEKLDDVNLVILDLDLPDGCGLEVLHHALGIHPDLLCIVLSGHASQFVAPPDLKHCIRAVVDKTEAYDDLRLALQEITSSRCDNLGISPQPTRVLTRREIEIFRLIGQGVISKQIAAELYISIQTVETHRKSIAKKLQSSGADLVRLASVFNQTALECTPSAGGSKK
jgi:two-component system, NarL family, response regulator DesR